MKNNLLIFLGFAVICLVNVSAQKRTQQASVTPPPAMPAPPAKVVPAPAANEGSASSGMSKLSDNHPVSTATSAEMR